MRLLYLAGCAALFAAGCEARPDPAVDPAVQSPPATGQQQLTFYVKGMNERLNVL